MVEVFATVDATTRYAALRARRRGAAGPGRRPCARVPVRLGHPGRSRRRLPLPRRPRRAALADAAPGRDLRRRARPRQRRHRDPHRRRGGRRRRRAGRQLRRRLQPQDGPGQRRQPLPPAPGGRARRGLALSRRPGRGPHVLAADGTARSRSTRPATCWARTAWLFGNEAWGLPPEVAPLADHRVRIPIHGRAESLNLSTAAALCLYASASAHRRTHGASLCNVPVVAWDSGTRSTPWPTASSSPTATASWCWSTARRSSSSASSATRSSASSSPRRSR